MAIHEVDTICPVCAKISMLGHTDMAQHPFKYICPDCGGRHYGEPESYFDNGYKCAQCGEGSEHADWKKILLNAGEHIQGPYQSCGSCNAKLAPDKVALIETKDGTEGEEGRTGRVFFIKPSKEFTKAIGGERCVYMNESALAKVVEGADETGS